MCLACDVALSDILRMEALNKTGNNNTILDTIYALAATVDAKDHHTYGHSKKVSKYATNIAEAIGYSKDGVERMRAAALLHDIGKIGISDQLLSKREPLSLEDWELIRAHPSLGVSILKHVDSLKGCLAAVQYHHERYDGTGYPAGLKGDNIPLDARILAVADTFDAMTSERPYRPGKATYEQALKELQLCSGTQFDPQIVKVFIDLYSESPKKDAKIPKSLTRN
jgi:putative nucleotidyltransferase with HDIG domain